MPTRRCVFLDRDGVINTEVAYLHDPEQLEIIAGVPQAIAQLSRTGAAVVVVTNQAGIARGKYTEHELAAVTARVDEILAAAGTHLDRTYFCPHHPDAGIGDYKRECRCRKPAPGMLEQAATELDLDLARSILVGDKITDLQAGRAAGCATVLVRTGYGAGEEEAARAAGVCDAVFDSLAHATPWILERLRG
ncbi:MAG TPA: D-glycero-beta-D-manno-heptose 1,7-bisphosphate 7-phosphatase [Kofleriaceae bacterium]|jgi:D-glycero-D-manno-heptose 1,7-bisphosphate phosphatase